MTAPANVASSQYVRSEKKENLMMAWVDVTIAHCNDTKLNIMASNMVLESII